MESILNDGKKNMKKILFVSNYYYPYISGVTEFERMIAEEFCKAGYEVKVLTARHDKKLPVRERINGVPVSRCNVQLKISKGTISIPFLFHVIREAKKYDIVNMQLPMLEAGLLSMFIQKKKLMPMYHCDMNLPKGLLNQMIVKVMDISHRICLRRSYKIWVSSIDYAKHSRVAGAYRDKLEEIGLPIKEVFQKTDLSAHTKERIGFCGRIVEEKGIDILIKAFELLQQEREDIELIVGGDYLNVAGGSVYPQLQDYIKEKQIQNIHFIGKIPEEKMSEFYSSLDVFVLPSVNSLEAFGMVQVEAMMCGTLVVASDLFGVRTVVEKTGMGLISKRGDEKDLAKCIGEILANGEAYRKNPDYIQSIFSTKVTIERICNVMNQI